MIRRTLMLAALFALATPASAEPPPDWAVAVFPSGAEFSLEIAATPGQRRIGYMYREEIPASAGMLFLFDSTERHGIWMKNCRVPLDIIWLDKSFRVTEIFADAAPCPADGACPSMEPMQTADYVLEVAAGRAAEEKLRPGDLIVIHAEPPLR